MKDGHELIVELIQLASLADLHGYPPAYQGALRDAAETIENLTTKLMKLEFELTARDVNDMAANEALEKLQENVKLIERRLTRRRKA